ncbi:hypothetical protein [Streptomyces sp. NPDC059906]|uniref:hypothetical protein n=1 Tax=Streptomyces sp. NPDC059906 TaxID=3346997 RepID=UPI00364B15D8
MEFSANRRNRNGVRPAREGNALSEAIGILKFRRGARNVHEVVRWFEKTDEVLQQQNLQLTRIDGAHEEFHAMMYLRFRDGLVDRVEEYGYATPASASGRC